MEEMLFFFKKKKNHSFDQSKNAIKINLLLSKNLKNKFFK